MKNINSIVDIVLIEKCNVLGIPKEDYIATGFGNTMFLKMNNGVTVDLYMNPEFHEHENGRYKEYTVSIYNRDLDKLDISMFDKDEVMNLGICTKSAFTKVEILNKFLEINGGYDIKETVNVNVKAINRVYGKLN